MTNGYSRSWAEEFPLQSKQTRHRGSACEDNPELVSHYNRSHFLHILMYSGQCNNGSFSLWHRASLHHLGHGPRCARNQPLPGENQELSVGLFTCTILVNALSACSKQPQLLPYERNFQCFMFRSRQTSMMVKTACVRYTRVPGCY